MSIFFSCMSSLPIEETRAKIDYAQERYHDILRYFWISKVAEAPSSSREAAAEYGFDAISLFLIQWNKEGGSEFIPQIPQIMYEVFGRDKLLVFDLNLEPITVSKFNRDFSVSKTKSFGS
jgi:hypothetical protein